MTTSGGISSYLQGISDTWRAAVPADACWYAVPHSPRARSRLVGELRGLPAGSQVVLFDGRRRSRARCRGVASRAGFRLVREYVALPTLASARVLVEDDDATAGYVAARFGSVPPAPTLRARLLARCMPVAGWLLAGRWRTLVFGGRVVIGVRP